MELLSRKAAIRASAGSTKKSIYQTVPNENIDTYKQKIQLVLVKKLELGMQYNQGISKHRRRLWLEEDLMLMIIISFL